MLKQIATAAVATTVGVSGSQYATKAQVRALQAQVQSQSELLTRIDQDTDLHTKQLFEMAQYQGYTMRWVDCLRVAINFINHPEQGYDPTICAAIGAPMPK